MIADTRKEPIRVVLADDHAVVRKGIREFLEEEGDIVVVAEAADGAQAVSLVVEHRPDVAVLDVQMPGMGGIEATRQIKAQSPAVRVLILTAYDDDPYIFALLHAGANGYILKTADSAELVRALRAVYRGESALDSAVTHKVVRQLTTGRPSAPPPEGDLDQAAAESRGKVPEVKRPVLCSPFRAGTGGGGAAWVETLTEREVQVLRLAAKGLTNKAIGHTLDISDRTVQGHLANIYGKLGVNSRTEAVTQALKQGWIVVE